MISNHEIDAYVANDPYISAMYGGTLAIDELPKYEITQPTLYIVNTDPAHMPGEHWLSLLVGGNVLNEHFDSIGNLPLPEVRNFLNNQSKISPYKGYYVYNHIRVQSVVSVTCGLFSLMYAYYRSRNVSFASFL